MTAPPVLGIAESARGIADGSLSPVALAEASLDRIAALDPSLHAFIEVTAARARDVARKAEGELRAGRSHGMLHGIPYGLKDLYDVSGLRTTAQSRVLIDNVATGDSDATARLEAAGMTLLGKLATHEFATGGPNDETPFPSAISPWHAEHFAGGSSSGSAVAVASGMLPLAMGSDTGGSIRLPAALCGIVGLKPTYGRLSRFGVVPLAFSMDHAGPLTRSVEDCAIAMQALAGFDPRDPGSADMPVPDYLASLRGGVAGMRIGYARAFNAEAGVDDEEGAAMDAAAAQLSRLGATVVDVALPSLDRMNAATWGVIHAEWFAIHRQDLRDRPGDYARITRERLMMGAFVTGAQYVQAQRLRRILVSEVDALLSDCDVLLVAPIAGAAPRLDSLEDIPLRARQPLTAPFNLTGHPALCVPSGLSANDLPLSLQIVGKQFGEAMVMRVGHAFEQATDWHGMRPPV